MSLEINGLKCSWDYNDLIKELEYDISYSKNIGFPMIYVQVLRKSEPVFGDYRPIIDYYETDDVMQSMCKIEVFDSEKEISDKNMINEMYLKDKPYLELMEVEKVLDEMRRITEIL